MGGKGRIRVFRQPGEEAVGTAESDEGLPEAAVGVFVDPEIPVVGKLHQGSEPLHSGGTSAEEPAEIDLRRAEGRVHHRPGPASVPGRRGFMMVEDEGVSPLGIMTVESIHGPAVLAEEVHHEEIMSCGDAFKDQPVHRPVPGQ
ncbi:hypothetical protein SDC9_164734 [bioreactor metagenome]|uniref:Uncharacterized protein n=1 Tax=bioreactor metagenome TaxID=1076179 RepID=A0A645FSG2_9ZZZZ